MVVTVSTIYAPIHMKPLLIISILLIVMGNAYCTYYGIPIAERLVDSTYLMATAGNDRHMPALPLIASVALLSVSLLMGSSVKKA